MTTLAAMAWTNHTAVAIAFREAEAAGKVLSGEDARIAGMTAVLKEHIGAMLRDAYLAGAFAVRDFNNMPPAPSEYEKFMIHKLTNSQSP